MVKYRNYEELHKHAGNEKYEVVTIVSGKKEVGYIHYDTFGQDFVLDAYYEPVQKKDSTYEALKIGKHGVIKDTFDIHTILKNGTMWDSEYYTNWIIDGDTTRKKYSYPLTKKEAKNDDKWFKTFKDLYEKASYIYIFQSEYYFNIHSKWSKLWYNDVVLENNFKKHFPAKEDQDVRMIELKDHTPDFSRGPTQRDTTLWTYHGYEEGDREEGVGLDPINFSSGWHYLQLKMPGSEPLKIRRYGSMGANMHTYIIPDSLGGRKDVVFIVQEPSSLYPDQEYGGMYVVRPRELKQ